MGGAVWWLFRAFGYDRVAVLDGGLTKCGRAEGRALETGHFDPEPAVFISEERPELWVDKAYVAGAAPRRDDVALTAPHPPRSSAARSWPAPGPATSPVRERN